MRGIMPSRRFLIALLGAVALLGGVSTGANTASAAGPKSCAISGTAHINPGLSTKSQKFTNTFTGAFTSCQNGGAVKSGTISEAGKGVGGCSRATTTGLATVRWNTGATSVIALKTSGVGSALYVSGNFVTGLYKGSKASALLNFNANPVQCANGGVSTATFNGVGSIR
jgi:hypothetical protein